MLGLGIGLTLPKTSTLTTFVSHKIRYLKSRTGEIAIPDNHYDGSATWRVSKFVIPLISVSLAIFVRPHYLVVLHYI